MERQLAAVQIAPAQQPPLAERPVEIVERKGRGHPDTLCDTVADAVSVALCGAYLAATGAVLHHNTDKVMLVAGRARSAFGGGQLETPMRLILGGRASSALDGQRFDVDSLARAAARHSVEAALRFVRVPEHVRVEVALHPGAAPLAGIFKHGGRVLAANDTSATVGYAPLTPTERLVLDTEGFLTSAAFYAEHPEGGEDVKVMACRRGDAVTLTVAMPLLDREILSEADYFDRKGAIVALLGRHLRAARAARGEQDAPLAIALNCLDRRGEGPDGLYLTVTGTCAEAADSGQTGRGNRVNGLIPLMRPGGAEAAAGKNPVAHVGKIYNVLAHAVAADLVAQLPGVTDATVWLVSRIGAPIDRPQLVSVALGAPPGRRFATLARAAEERVAAALHDLPRLTAALARGEHRIC